MASSVTGIGRPRVGAVILAGGTSSRMGTDKAALVIDKTPLLGRVAAAITESVEGPIVVVGNATQSCRLLAATPAVQTARRFWDYTCLDDAPDGTGPADALCLGVDTLVRRFPSLERVVVSPCDLPKITSNAFTTLLASDARSTIDVEQSLFDESTPKATVVRIDGRPQWLSAVLHQPLLHAIANSGSAQQRRVSDVFANAVITWFDDVTYAFRDADTPVDLREAIVSTVIDVDEVDEKAELADAS